MVIRNFEDIESWQCARRLTVELYKASNQHQFAKDFALRDQTHRAAISIMANIAEGFGRRGTPEMIRFLTIAQASCIELQSHLYVALDLNYLEQSAFNDLRNKATTVERLIGFIRYLTNNPRPTTNQKLRTTN